MLKPCQGQRVLFLIRICATTLKTSVCVCVCAKSSKISLFFSMHKTAAYTERNSAQNASFFGNCTCTHARTPTDKAVAGPSLSEKAHPKNVTEMEFPFICVCVYNVHASVWACVCAHTENNYVERKWAIGKTSEASSEEPVWSVRLSLSLCLCKVLSSCVGMKQLLVRSSSECALEQSPPYADSFVKSGEAGNYKVKH